MRRGDQGRPDEALDSALPGAEDGAHGNGLPAELVGERARMELLALGDGGSCSVHLEAGTLYDLLLRQAQRTPDELAVVDGDFGLTYRELVRRSNGVALRLQALGVQPGQPVAILVDRAAESLIGVLGICASGGAYVPIDVAHPDERTDFILRSSAATILLATGAARERAMTLSRRQPGAASLRYEIICDAVASDSLTSSGAGPSSAAYVIYTSGSTGTPKGVVVEHRSALNLVRGFLARHRFERQRLLMIPPLFFDASVGDFFPAFAVGATLVLHPAPATLGATELERFCLAHGITAIDAPAALWRRWVEEWASELQDRPRVSGLELMMIGGESVSLELVRKFARATGGHVTLSNHYGPTETAVCATMATTTDGREFSGTELPIGRPLPGLRVYVVDEDLRLLPRGDEGELCIGGVAVSRGYLGAADSTAKCFVPDPFVANAQARMYRTGDVVRWSSDGSLQFVGRRDSQVKIRGFRIELGEIEARLSEHTAVREAVVVARDSATGDKQLVAYVIPAESSNGRLQVEALHQHLSLSLPAYMVPAAYVALARLPLTANGKLDSRALPEPSNESFFAYEYVTPAGAVEIQLAEIWGQVLKRDSIGRNDHFFRLGGHSLLAANLTERVRRAGYDIEVRAIFEAPVLADFAVHAERSRHEAKRARFDVPDSRIPVGCNEITTDMLPLVNLSQQEIDGIVAAVPDGARNVQDIYPLAPLQEGFLFHHLLDKEGDVYLAPTLFSIARRSQVDRYLQALRAVIARHDILRTSIAWERLREPVQVVWRDAPFVVEEVRVDPDGGDVAKQLSARFNPRRYRIDVRQAPMWRVFIAEDAANSRWIVLELMHHLIGDHITLQVMQREIQAFMRNRGGELPKPIPFRNFIAQARLGVTREEHEAFFRRMLSEVEEPTAPFGLLDTQGDGSRMLEAHHKADARLNERIRACARARGVSVATLVHLAWGLVLARTAGRDDVVFGTVMFGRMQGGEGAERALGIFINTLPLRIRLGTDDVSSSVQRTHEWLVGLLKHEHAPLTLAQRCSGVEAPMPLFTSLLNYRFVGRREATLIRDAVKPEAGESLPEELGGMQLLGGHERANYPFDVSVNDSGEELSFDAQTEGSVDPARICMLLDTTLTSLVTALEKSPGLPVRALEVLPLAEREQLERFNHTYTELPRSRCIHELFEEQAARTPEAIAVVHSGEKLSYGELNARANRLGRHLRRLGVGPEQRVVICLERSLEMIEGVLAVLKCGGAYVPLDPTYAASRLKHMLVDSAPMAMLVDSRPTTRLALQGIRDQVRSLVALDLQNDRSSWARESRENLDAGSAGIGPQTLAYVIYTSGSTGQPKGVMVEHASVLNLIHAHIRNCALDARDVVLQFASFGFDASVEEIFPPLSVGARIVLRPHKMVAPDEEFEQLLYGERVTVAEFPTAFWHQWVQWGKDPEYVWGLRLVVVGGEKAERRWLEKWKSQARNQAGWLNTYGPTETTVYSTALLIDAERALHEGEIPIGGPICNTQLYVLDAHQQLLAIGATGELYIGGAGVARGYLNRPELTAGRFIASPFVPGERLYRTGDRVRWRPDGTLEYLGRNDFQVKIRGFRIELAEIEACLIAGPGVREAVVIARGEAEKQLVAYVIPADSSRKDARFIESLRGYVSERLPPYMLPAAFVVLERFPLNASGKLDRRAFPEPGGPALSARDYDAPQGGLELALERIWCEVLQRERVSRNASFFELGGHSLLAVRLISRIRDVLGVEVSMRGLFANPVLSQLASNIECSPAARASSALAGPASSTLAASFAQQRLWFLAQVEGASEAYHIPIAQHLRGPLDRESLQRALDRILSRHEALRTGFERVNNETVQRVSSPATSFPLRFVHRTGASESELQREIDAAISTPFDLSQAPLIQGRLIQLAEQHHVLVITMHHIVSDGWSVGVFVRELSALYAAFVNGSPDGLPPLSAQYSHYTMWQRERLTADVLRAQGEYWGSVLAGTPALLEVPTDRVRPPRQDFSGDAVKIRFPAELTRGLKALAGRHGMTLYMVVLAGWAALLARLSGQSDIVIGTQVANRARREFEGLIGFFVNTQAIRVPVRGSVREVLEVAKARVLEAQEYADLPFEQVVEITKPPRSLAHAPIFQATLAWQSPDVEQWLLPGLEISPAPIGYPVAKFDLELDLHEAGEEVAGDLRYATGLFDRPTIERHVSYLERMLTAFLETRHESVESINILGAEERRKLVETWNEPCREFPVTRSIHQLFEAQAARRSDSIAVVHDAHSLSYGELNRRANQLARHLIRQGVVPEDRVALCVARGLDMIVAILAILKAGAAYVPLDPVYPDERLSYVLRDCEPRLLLMDGSSRAIRQNIASTVVCVHLRDESALWSDSNSDNLNLPNLTPRQPAYIIYTSGSTGAPKGVVIEHANVVRLFAATQELFEFEAGDVWTLFHSFAFDFSVWELWGALLEGGRLVVVPQAIARSPEDFHALVCKQHVTVLNQTPSAFTQFVAPQAQSPLQHALRLIIFGGEALDLRSLEPWYRRNPDDRPRLVNMYGITETTVHVTYRPLRAADLERFQGRSPIGCRIPDLRLYVLDTQCKPVPVGVVGELYVGGAGVARGYLNRPELTTARFIPDPFVPGGRLYKSGDLVRWRDDGSLEYLGRNDFQVKIRGFRIELGEIEARLAEHAAVRDAVVIARDQGAGDRQLVAYVTAADGSSGGVLYIDSLRRHLSAHLPPYMVPAAYVVLPSLPLTENGKLDRKALPPPAGEAFGAREYEAPQDGTERTLEKIWSQVLKRDRISRQDNFFELGGHSLLAVTLVEHVRRAGYRSDVRTVFEAPTLARFANAVRESDDRPQVVVPPNLIPTGCDAITPEMLPLVRLDQDDIERIVAAVPGGARNVQDIYPLAPLQEGFLFHHLLAKQGDVYLTTALMAVDDRAQIERYAGALRAVIARHDILRTALMWEGLPEAVQVVWREAPLAVEELNLDPAEGDIAAQLSARIDPRHYRIDIQRAPMWYLFIAEDSPNSRWVMIELIHHLIDDRTTMRFLRDEIRAVMQGHGDSLPPPVPFRNSIAQARLGISRAEHEAFFRQMLGDVRQPTAPFGLLDVQGDGSKIAEAYRELDAHLNRRLHVCARLLGVSTASLCHLAWGLVLSQTCGRDDVVFGTVMFGRTFAGEDAARALGMFINTLPLCIRLGKDDVTLSARATHDWLVQLLKHEHAPLALAQRCSGVRAPTPLFTSLLNYRHFTPDSHDSDESLSGMKLLAGYERANYPVNLSINDSGEGLSLDAQVDASIDADYVCELMHTALASLVDALEHSPSMPVSALQVLPAGYNHSGFQVATHERTSLPERDRFVPTPYEAPRDLIENAVARIWADILKHERVGRLDHFFELGGHSLLAMQTVQRLKRAGLDVAVPDLFSYPTVEALASAVRARSFEAQASVRPPLAGVALSRARVRQVRQGAQTPLFLLHDGYGDELYFSVLAHHLPGGFPVIGLPPTGPSEPLLDTVEAMAARMLDLISGVQYNGPYRLLGWSFGGLLAYEMAHQLSERGEVVEFLGLIDAFCPDAGPVHPLPARTPEAVLRALGQSVFAGRPGVGVDSSSDEADVGFDELLVRYRGKGILPTSFEYLSTAEVREQCRQLDMNGRAMQIYRPRSISVAVDLFVADEQSEALPAAERRALGWQRCVAPHLLRVYRVPGTHESMMKVPHVRVLGDTVGKALTAPVEQHHNTAREAAISEIRRAGLGVPNA